MDKLSALRAFAMVIEEGGFTAAAQRLRVAKSAISKQVQALEDELGARLLNRTTRKVSPTEDGEGFYTRVRQILDDLDEAEATLHDQSGAPRGILKIAGPMSFGVAHLSTAVAAFMHQHTEIKVELHLDDRFVDLIEGGYDLAIRIGRLPDSSLKVRRIAPIRSVLCAAPAYLAEHGTPTCLADLAHHRLLHYGLLATGDVWRLIDPNGEEQRLKVQPAMMANNGHALRDAAIVGNGICLQPTFIVWEALRAGTLVQIMPDWTTSDAAIHVVYPPGRHQSPKVRAFIDFFAEHCGSEPYWDCAP